MSEEPDPRQPCYSLCHNAALKRIPSNCSETSNQVHDDHQRRPHPSSASPGEIHSGSFLQSVVRRNLAVLRYKGSNIHIFDILRVSFVEGLR